MSQGLKILNGLIEEKLYNLHTLNVGRVERVNANGSYDVQILVMTKEVGAKAEKVPLLVDVPAVRHRVKLDGVSKTLTSDYKRGNLVLVGFCERDVDGALAGQMALPQDFRRHSLNDAIIIGGLS